MKIFDASLQINGFDIAKAKLRLKQIHSISNKDFKSYVESQRKVVLKHHLDHNSFYKKFTKGHDCSRWEDVPILKKRDLQIPLNDRLSDGYTTKNVYVNKTSGSSGDPFIFAKDKDCHALTWAVIIDRFGWHGIDFNHSKQARFYGIPLDRKGYYKERFKDWLGRRYRFSVFDLSNKAFENCLSKFKNTAFKYINGYTSAIVQFAKYLDQNSLVLKELCPSLKVCVVTSEMLFDNDKKLMEKRFGVPVINEYGASELDIIAFQNSEGQFQVNSETLFVEILDDNDKVLPYGSEGRMVITSLYNMAHPFIRYDIGDIGVLSEDSAFKNPVLKSLVGRVDDLIHLPSGKKAAGLTFYYITKSIIEDDGNVKEFVIEQLQLDTFKIKYQSEKAINETQKQCILKALDAYLEPRLNIIFERTNELQRSKSGKLKQFKSHLQ